MSERESVSEGEERNREPAEWAEELPRAARTNEEKLKGSSVGSVLVFVPALDPWGLARIPITFIRAGLKLTAMNIKDRNAN